MKAYSIHWKDETLTAENDKDKPGRGTTIVLADSITKAIARFQRDGLVREIDSVYLESNEVMIDPS